MDKDHPDYNRGYGGEVRLVAMEFHPSDQGGFWWPASVPVTAAGEQTGWVNAWQDAITKEEYQAADRGAETLSEQQGEALASFRRKGRAAFNPEGKRCPTCGGSRGLADWDALSGDGPLVTDCPDSFHNPEGEQG